MGSFKITLIAVSFILVVLTVVNLTMRENLVNVMSGGAPSISHGTH